MNKVAIITKARRIGKISTGLYSDADMLIDLNLHQGELLMMVLEAQGYRNIQETGVYFDIIDASSVTAGQVGFNGEYPFDSSLIRPTRIEVQYTTTGDKVPVDLYEASENNYSEYDDDIINATFSQSEPKARLFRDSFKLRPVPDTNITAGGYMEFTKRQTDLSADADVPILELNFHRIYPLLLCKEHSLRNPDVSNPAWEIEIDKLKRDIKKFYRDRFKFTKKITPVYHSFE